MPPQRRRRPVQPATHVRLPRAARPRGASGTDITDPESPDLETTELETPEREAAEPGLDETPATAAEPATDTEPATDSEVATDTEPATDAEVAAEPAAAEELAADEAPGADEAPTPVADKKPRADRKPTPEADKKPRAEADKKPGADEKPTAGEGAPTAVRERRGPLAIPAVLGVIAVILGGLAVWFGLEAGNATSGVDTSNVALTDPAATSRLTQQIATAVNTIFSYNYADTARTSQAAATLLTGRAQGEYNTLFRLVRQDAPKEKLVLTTTVTNAGVEYLIGNQARLLIFANQKDTAGAAHNATEAGAMFAVNAVYTDGRWKIAHIDTFGASG